MEYRDQDNIIIYSLYDESIGLAVPSIIQLAQVINQTDVYTMVQINYPVIDGIWTLAGTIGDPDNDWKMLGRKAYVFDGRYSTEHGEIIATIETWDALEYLQESADQFRTDVTEMVDKWSSQYDLEAVFTPVKGNIFIPVICNNTSTQEGLHRTIWALNNDIDEIPVIVISGSGCGEAYYRMIVAIEKTREFSDLPGLEHIEFTSNWNLQEAERLYKYLLNNTKTNKQFQELVPWLTDILENKAQWVSLADISDKITGVIADELYWEEEE